MLGKADRIKPGAASPAGLWSVAVNTLEAAENRYQEVPTALQESGYWLAECHP